SQKGHRWASKGLDPGAPAEGGPSAALIIAPRRPPRRSHDMIPAGRKSSAQRAGQKLGLALKGPEPIIVLAYIINRPAPMPLSCFLRCEGEVGEIGSLLRGAFCPEDEKLAST